MKKYTLSVVVLVYNTENYLRDCLDSLINQSLDNIQIIIVNDESPDNSHVIIDEYKQKYSNIIVIDQENSGGAVAGNNGIKVATGDYVALVDSDDIVPVDAYEKLYRAAQENKSQIAIGRPLILEDGVIKEVNYKKERRVWEENQLISDLSQFPEIFYDGFYWNKIFDRKFLLKNNCLMPEGYLYADRPMVHKAYLYADRISIICDNVYIWRRRNIEESRSITQQKTDLDNFQDRMSSLFFQVEYFKCQDFEKYKNDFDTANLERVLFPIKGIVTDKVFREEYLRLAKEYFLQVKDIYNNDLGVQQNLYIYMILNDLREELMYLLAARHSGKIIDREGVFYWALPFFDNKQLSIPLELYRIKKLIPLFLKISEYEFNHSGFNLAGIIHGGSQLGFKEVYLKLRHRTGIQEYSFPVELDEKGRFNIFLSLDSMPSPLGVYNVLFQVFHKGKSSEMLVQENMFLTNFEQKRQKSNNKLMIFYLTKKRKYLALNIAPALKFTGALAFKIKNIYSTFFTHRGKRSLLNIMAGDS